MQIFNLTFVLIVTTTKAKKDANRRDSSNMTFELWKDVLISELWVSLYDEAASYLGRRRGLQWCQHQSEFLRMPFLNFFSLDWGEESRGDQRTDQFNSSADTADTAVSASWLKAMMLFFFFTTPDDLKQSIKYKKVPYENLRMITKGSPGPPKGKNSRYPLQLWDFFSLSPNSIQSETLKLLLFKTGPSCWAPWFHSGPSRPGALNASFN